MTGSNPRHLAFRQDMRYGTAMTRNANTTAYYPDEVGTG